MPNNYVQVSNITHNYTAYSPENIKRELDALAERGLPSEVTQKYQRYLENYPEEFSVLYRVSQQSISSDINVSYDLKEVPYRRPEIACEEYDVAGKSKQLELECTMADGTKFGLSALKTSTEPQQMQGQISFPDETLRDLNDEKLKQIFEFCHKYGFSTFGLSLPLSGGVIDVDAKLKELFDRYQEKELQNRTENPGAPKPDEAEETHAQNTDENVNIPSAGQNIDMSPHYTTVTEDVPTIPNVSLEQEVMNFENMLRKDYHKREYRSYWKHVKRMNGVPTYVFSVYDKENPDNYKNDGKADPKNPYVHVPTYAYRLYVSYSNDRFHFGYATPGGKPFDQSLAGDVIGEIKKTGITHLNLSAVPNCDKMTWMMACAEKGIVPKGVKITRDKAEKMLNAAKAKLSKEELSAFERRLMEQWEANYAAKGDTLSVSDQAYIQQCKNESVDLLRQQKNELSAANLNRDFINFKTAYLNELKPLVEQKIEEGSRDTERGAAITMGGMQTLRATFDLYFGDKNAPDLNVSLGSRIEKKYQQLERNLQMDMEKLRAKEQQLLAETPRDDVRIKDVQEEQRLLQQERKEAQKEKNILMQKIDISKPVKALTTEDFKLIYETLYPLEEKRMERAIIQAFKYDRDLPVHRADDVIIGSVIFSKVKGSVKEINTVLYNNNLENLELPLEHSGLLFARPQSMRKKPQTNNQTQQTQASQNQAASPASAPATPAPATPAPATPAPATPTPATAPVSRGRTY